MTWFDILLWAGIVALVMSPPRWDPAIRIKERQRTGSWKWPYD